MTTDWLLSDPLFRLQAEWVHPAIANAFPREGKVELSPCTVAPAERNAPAQNAASMRVI